VDYFTSFLSTGENEVIGDIPRFHKTLAEMIDNTYKGSRENVKGYSYVKSLNIENTLYKPLLALGLSGIAERYLPQAFTQLVRQRVGEIAPRREFGGFLSNLIPMFRDEITTGNYILEGNILRERNLEGVGRFVGERMGNVMEAEEIGRYDRISRSGRRYEGGIMRTGSRTFVMPSTEQAGERDWFYKPQVPLGFFSIIPFAIMYQKALNSIEGTEEQISGISPRINYYRYGNDDVFTIRGTQTVEDLAHDLLLGGEVFGYKTGLMEKKIELYEKFINENRRPDSKVIITGHSLGALEMSYLMEKMNADETVGFSQPVFKPHSKIDVSYSFDKDPLFRNTGVNNHKVLRKNIGDNNLFKDYHSIINYY